MKKDKVFRSVRCDRCQKMVDLNKVNLLPGRIFCNQCLIVYGLSCWLKKARFSTVHLVGKSCDYTGWSDTRNRFARNRKISPETSLPETGCQQP
ncbi:MAG: hypothetical protein BA867_06915 [Desulfobacterales bacterium S5133MH16]|nr:MAG: hypothetical protein BA867_06915 [Desulfobacterales bacterium S5133MH16]